MFYRKNTNKLVLIIFLFVFFSPFTVNAITYSGGTYSKGAKDDNNYTLLQPLPGIEKKGEPTSKTDLGSYLENLFNLGLGIAGILAVLMIMIGGIQYMTEEAALGKSAAKGRITNAILGLMLALSSWLLLHTINPGFTSVSLNLKPVEIPLMDNPEPPTTYPYTGSCYLYDENGKRIGSFIVYGSDSESACEERCTNYCADTSGCEEIDVLCTKKNFTNH